MFGLSDESSTDLSAREQRVPSANVNTVLPSASLSFTYDVPVPKTYKGGSGDTSRQILPVSASLNHLPP